MGRLLPFEPSLLRFEIITAAKRKNAKSRRNPLTAATVYADSFANRSATSANEMASNESTFSHACVKG